MAPLPTDSSSAAAAAAAAAASSTAKTFSSSLSPPDRINQHLHHHASASAPASPNNNNTTTTTIPRFFSRFASTCRLQPNGLHQLSPTQTRALFSFVADRFYCNHAGNLHGGAQALFFDICTSLALLAVQRRSGSGGGSSGWDDNVGVSRVLTVNYVRPAPEGVELEMECDVVHRGRRLALLRGVLRRKADGAVVSTCEHHKVAVEKREEEGEEGMGKRAEKL